MKRYMIFLIAGLAACTLTACDKVKEKVEEVSAEITGKVQSEKTDFDNLLEQIQYEGTLTIGISADYAPFCYLSKNDYGQTIYAGSDVALGEYLAQRLGVQAEFQEMSFESCLQAAKDGIVDVVLLGMMPVVERLAYVDFSTVYYQPEQQVFLIKKEAASTNNRTTSTTTNSKTNTKTNTTSSYTTLEDFSGKTLAAQYGSLQAQLIVEQLPESFIELSDNVEEGIALLENGVVDAVVLDGALAEEYLGTNSDYTLAEAVLEYTPKKIVAGVAEREPELLEEINHIISDVVEQNLYLHWIDEANEQAMWDNLQEMAASQESSSQKTQATTESGTATSDVEVY